jgi:hypothetical protein
MVRMLAMVPDPPHTRSFVTADQRTLEALKARGLVADRYHGWFARTPFGRETAERLARRAEK